MSVDLNLVADVIEKLASHYDQIESTRIEAETQEREQAVTAFKDKFAAEFGEELPDEVLAKISGLDPDVQAVLSKMASQGEPDDLGEPSEIKEAGVPLTKKERVEHASNRFLEFCIKD